MGLAFVATGALDQPLPGTDNRRWELAGARAALQQWRWVVGGKVLFVTALIVALAAAGVAQTMYARTSTVVRDGTRLSAKLVTRLHQRDPVEVLARTGRHYKVNVGGKTGWAYHSKLAPDRPEDVAAALRQGPGEGMIKLDEIETSGAMRGLSPMAEKYAAGGEIPEWAVEAVEAMQGRGITPVELDAFARAGGLDEYAEGE